MSRPPRLWKAFRLPLAALLTATVHGCGEPSGGAGRIPAAPLAPRGPAGSFQPIIHTIDGRHFAFRPGDFEPASVEHCREDGSRHLTSIFELTGISPIGRRSSLCEELAGSYLILHHTTSQIRGAPGDQGHHAVRERLRGAWRLLPASRYRHPDPLVRDLLD